MHVTILTYSFSIALYLIALLLIFQVLERKKSSVAALAWIMAIIFLPYIGAIIYLLFGNNHIVRPLTRKKMKRENYRSTKPVPGQGCCLFNRESLASWKYLCSLMTDLSGFPPTRGNDVTIYHDVKHTYDAMFRAIQDAKRDICLQMYVFQNDSVGREFIDRLTHKAENGVSVRLLYDAIGSHALSFRTLKPLLMAGGKAVPFLPVSLLHRRFQINLRNHRKILVVDGHTGFIGGMNIGKEYLGNDPEFGPWRDTHMRITGPAVQSLAYVFAEDWHFATDEYLPSLDAVNTAIPEGEHEIQIVTGGPDQSLNPIREWYYTTAVRAAKRLWIASPYFIPDETMIDGLRMAAHMGVDVRLLIQSAPPDQWITYFASRYYWTDMLKSGVRIWQYSPGMFHPKIILVDGVMASVGTANFDIRSLRLNFEVNAIIYTPALIESLEKQYLSDLDKSREVILDEFSRRGFFHHVAENASRMFSPLL